MNTDYEFIIKLFKNAYVSWISEHLSKQAS